MKPLTGVKYQKDLPSISLLKRLTKGQNFVVLYDEKLKSRANFLNWLNDFSHQFPLLAGEKLKDIDCFAPLVKKILPCMAGFSPQQNVIVAVGGGSIGDVAGFLASVIKRGVQYVHIPSTWLAAVDSAHGGKTALNVGELKNQVGSFYDAQFVCCVKSILDGQPEENVKSAYGEVLKVGLLVGKSLYQKLCRLRLWNGDGLWRLLPDLVEAKLTIVKRDPKEVKGNRQLLNLGHTVGHIFELENKIPHGIAVQMGLRFSVEWSYRRQLLNHKDYLNIKKLIMKNEISEIYVLPTERFQMRLMQDKKALSGDRVRFIFVKKPGKPILEEVPVKAIVNMAKQMGWAK